MVFHFGGSVLPVVLAPPPPVRSSALPPPFLLALSRKLATQCRHPELVERCKKEGLEYALISITITHVIGDILGLKEKPEDLLSRREHWWQLWSHPRILCDMHYYGMEIILNLYILDLLNSANDDVSSNKEDERQRGNLLNLDPLILATTTTLTKILNLKPANRKEVKEYAMVEINRIILKCKAAKK